jgi:general secretion pathway protein A
MYLDFFGFREKPFNLTPDPCFVFLSKTHKKAFAHLLFGISNRAGFIGLTGEVGSGKTTVLRALFSQLDTDHHRTALIFNPCLSAPELLQSINREFGISTYTSNSPGALDALNLFLLEQNTEGRTVVLAIDEAQNLEASVLEQIRLISNLETGKEKLIQIILSGQPELLEILKRDEMRQLSQRITVRYHLQPSEVRTPADNKIPAISPGEKASKNVIPEKANVAPKNAKELIENTPTPPQQIPERPAVALPSLKISAIIWYN